jgi:quinol monooxygenase YgiN
VLVVTRYRVPAAEQADFLARARAAVAALAARPGCLTVRVGRAVDEPELWVLQSSWESVGAYRRGLSSYEVKLHAVPLMYRCIDEPTAFEVLLEATDGDDVVESPTLLAEDPPPTS